MARRSSLGRFFADVGSAFLRISHRVPLVGMVAAILCAAGWWYWRDSDAMYGAAGGLAVALGVLGGVFLVLALVGWLRNLFPESERRRESR